MDDYLYDCMATVGDDNPLIVGAMLEALAMAMSMEGWAYSAYLTGHGRWGGDIEASGALLYTDLTTSGVAALRAAVTDTVHHYRQDAIGLFVVTAGSALIFRTQGGR